MNNLKLILMRVLVSTSQDLEAISTDTCLINLTDFIKFQMDKGHLVGMVFLDLQKVFYTVDYGI